MNPIIVRRSLAVVLLLCSLAGCGGGSNGLFEPDAATARRQSVAATEQQGIPALTTAQLFGWAEAQYPTLFPAGPGDVAIVYDGRPFTIRSYDTTRNYLGVSDGQIYGLGPFTNNVVHGFGFVADFTCTVAPQRCPPALGITLAWDTGAGNWDGGDWK
jgi:predicted small lipoprotein YifL